MFHYYLLHWRITIILIRNILIYIVQIQGRYRLSKEEVLGCELTISDTFGGLSSRWSVPDMRWVLKSRLVSEDVWMKRIFRLIWGPTRNKSVKTFAGGACARSWTGLGTSLAKVGLMCCQMRNVGCRCLDISEPICGVAGNRSKAPYYLIFIVFSRSIEKKMWRISFVANTRKNVVHLWCNQSETVRQEEHLCIWAAFKRDEVAAKEQFSLHFCPIKASEVTRDEFAPKTALACWRYETRVMESTQP